MRCLSCLVFTVQWPFVAVLHSSEPVEFHRISSRRYLFYFMAAMVPPAAVVLSHKAVCAIENVPLSVCSQFAGVQC